MAGLVLEQDILVQESSDPRILLAEGCQGALAPEGGCPGWVMCWDGDKGTGSITESSGKERLSPPQQLCGAWCPLIAPFTSHCPLWEPPSHHHGVRVC